MANLRYRTTHGPIAFEELKQLWRQGTVVGSTHVWQTKMGETWAAIETLPVVVAALSSDSAAAPRASTPSTHALCMCAALVESTPC